MRKTLQKNLQKTLASALIAGGLLASNTTNATTLPINGELYDTNSGGYVFGFQTTNPVNSFSYETPINFSDKGLILDTTSPEGYNCNAIDNSGKVLVDCTAIPTYQTSSGIGGFNLDLQALGWDAGTSMQDIVNLYGTSQYTATFNDVYNFTETGILNLPNGLYANQVSSVPIPASAWLFGSGLLGLVGVGRRKKCF